MHVPVADRRQVVPVRVGVDAQGNLVRWIARQRRVRRGVWYTVPGHWRRFIGGAW